MHFADISGKVRSAARTGDLIYARWAAHCLANDAAGMVAIINKRYYSNQWGKHLPEVLKCKILPTDFKRCYEILWLSSNFEELTSAIRHLYTEFERILRELGAKIPHVKSIQEGMKTSKSQHSIVAVKRKLREIPPPTLQSRFLEGQLQRINLSR